MIDKNSLLKSQGSLYLEFIPTDGLFHKMLLLSLMGFLTGWCNLLPAGTCWLHQPLKNPISDNSNILWNCPLFEMRQKLAKIQCYCNVLNFNQFKA